MDKQELRERYEATGEERFYEQANSLYEDALAREPGDARLLLEYGYLLECRARYAVRAAITYYQRAVDAEPRWQKAHLQLISALAAVQELDDRVFARYERWIAEDPGEPVGYRLLAFACLRAGDRDRAERTIRAGLLVAPDDAMLIEQQGDLYAATGRLEETLASWRRAFTLAPEDYAISMRFSAAFLLERLGRLAEAADEWRFIIGWNEERGQAIHLDWPRRELQRLEAEVAGG
jgi:tetratricopeptide (TPR) repeat protein